MAYIKQIEIDKAEGTIARLYEAAIQRTGDVANFIRVMSQHGSSANASIGLYVALMKSTSGITPSQREMLAAVVSNVNDCFY
jgi:hypothetical protein